MRPSTARGLALLLMTTAAMAQQPNTGSATMTIDGAVGPPYPVTTNVRTNTTVGLVLSGSANAGYLIGLSATGLVQPGTLVTGGGIVDIPLVPEPVIAVQGALDPAGSAAFGVVVPPVGVPPSGVPLGHQVALQAVIADPSSPVGWRLTAATQVTVLQGPITVNLNLGSDGAALIDLAPHGFSIPFYGVSYSQLWMCVNGFLTLGSPDTDFTPSAIEFNTGPPRIAPFWCDLEQGGGGWGPTPAAQVRYTIDANPVPGQAASVKAEWMGVVAWGTPLSYNFTAFADANGFCSLSYSTVNSLNIYTTLCGIGPGLGLNPQTTKDLSALHFAGYAGAAFESFFELFPGPSVYPGPGPFPGPPDLYGLTLSFQPIAGGSPPGATSAYFLY